MTTPVYQRLYVRIWLAVVGTIAVMAMLAGWLARMEFDHERAQRPGREIVLRNAAGEVIGQAPARPIRVPGARVPGADDRWQYAVHPASAPG